MASGLLYMLWQKASYGSERTVYDFLDSRKQLQPAAWMHMDADELLLSLLSGAVEATSPCIEIGEIRKTEKCEV